MVLFIDAVDEMLSEKGLGFVTNIINIAFIVLLAILITKGVRRLMQRLRSSRRISDDPVKQKRAETAETLMASIIKYVTYFIAAALIASELGFGASVRSLLAAAGIGGIVIGIGAQSLISDIVNGFFFLFEDQFSVGDMIDAGGITGTVESIGLRTTTVRAFTGEVSVIPNGSIRTLTNYSRTNSLAIVDIPVALSADADAAMALMRQEAERYCAEIADKVCQSPEVYGINDVGPFAKTMRLVVSVKPLEHWAVQRELRKRILERFVREGIKLPSAERSGNDRRL